MTIEELRQCWRNYEDVRPQLCSRLINREKNEAYLSGMPEKEWLDLALICFCRLRSADGQEAAVPVRGTWMKFWGIRKEELFRDAEENRNREEKPRLVRLDTLIPEFRTREGKDSPLYVLSYEQRPYGAVWMTDPDVLRLAGASLGSSYFILPSSVHECLLLPDTGEYETVYLNWLVREVNRTQLQPEEVLADHIYRYDRHSDVLRCCY